MTREQKKKRIEQMALHIYKQSSEQQNNVNLTSVLTEHEKIAIGRRLLIAQAILAGKTRRELEDTLYISPNTFAQVNQWLTNEFAEYKPVRKKTETVKPKKVRPFSFEHLRRKYPMHFALFSLAKEVWDKQNR
jgi:Trp operon repressor